MFAAANAPVFAASSAFWREVRTETAAALASRPEHPSVGDPRLHRKALVIVMIFLSAYAALLAGFGPAAVVLLAMLQGAAAATLGLGVFHDAGHSTFSRRAATNRLVARACCVMLGPSRFYWDVKHHRLHHRAPNIAGWDDDVDARGVLRLTPEDAWAPRFAAQHLRLPFLYALNTIEWFFLKDFLCLWRGRLNPWQPARPTGAALVEFWTDKALWFVLFVLPPFLLLPFAWAVMAFLAYHFVFSLALTFVFQLAHLTPDMAFGPPRPGDDFASHQLRTTANFATGSLWVTWFTGGLNHQIEHHLLPGVAHTHYRMLAPVVAAAARRHGLPYHDLGGLSTAIRQHVTLVRELGLPRHG